jgi:response regulator NasT
LSAPFASLRILLIDDDPVRAATLESTLARAGHAVAARAGREGDLSAQVRTVRPELVIVALDSPDRDMIDSMRILSHDEPRPIVMFVDKDEGGLAEEAIRAGVSSYVVDGLAPARVEAVLRVAIARFQQYQGLREELRQARSDLANRKVIERAKGLLMKERGLSEEAAYQALRKLAMDQNRRLVEVARSLISVAELLRSG